MKKNIAAALAFGVALGLPGAVEVRPSRQYVVGAGEGTQILQRLRAFYGQRPRPWRPHALDSRNRRRELNRAARALQKRHTAANKNRFITQKGRIQ